ncbi:MAG: hypothetical protein ACUVTP_05900 [Candidatus Fervidibacter sp.]|uniref:hypothetical protein n=1 Tax=Candidatus Fervidibacter sp. TaxID=3100871 RepID=UPI004049616B
MCFQKAIRKETFPFFRHPHITVGLWANFEDSMHQRFTELSDFISFHSYDPPDAVLAKVLRLKRYNRPILCTEFLRRRVGNTFASILPIFAEHQFGWYFGDWLRAKHKLTLTGHQNRVTRHRKLGNMICFILMAPLLTHPRLKL